MGDLVRCSQCKGGKIVTGLGGITKKCEPCKGIGFLQVETKQPEALADKTSECTPVSNQSPESPKRGRPKKEDKKAD